MENSTTDQIDLITKTFETAFYDRKVADIATYSLYEPILFCERVLLVSVSNKTHLKALANDLKKLHLGIEDLDLLDGVEPKVFGKPDSGWVIADFSVVLIHLVLDDILDYYDLKPFYEKKGMVIHS